MASPGRAMGKGIEYIGNGEGNWLTEIETGYAEYGNA